MAIRDRLHKLYYVEPNKPGQLLARALHAKNSITSISKLKHPAGQITHLPKEMNDLFRSFYDSLYNLPPCPPTSFSDVHLSRIADYIAQTTLPTIHLETVQDLEQPFTEEELSTAISSLKKNKSPGPDGYTARF